MKNSLQYKLQTLGSIFLMSGYFILLYFDVYTGVLLRLIANCCLLPYPIKMKYWNLIILESFFITIDGSKLIQLTFFK